MTFLRILCLYVTLFAAGVLFVQLVALAAAFKFTGHAWFFPPVWFVTSLLITIAGIAVEVICRKACKRTTS